MTSRERVIRALNRQSLDRVPRDLWLLPGVEADHADDVAELNLRCSCDVLHLDTQWPAGKRTKGASNRAGHYTDAWGCSWQLGSRGAPGPLVESPLVKSGAAASYEPPLELLDAGRFAKANRGCQGTSQFVLAWSDARPMDRLMWLCGPEATISEIASQSHELRRLLGKIHDFFRREIEIWAATDVDGVVFGDGLGNAAGLQIPLRVFRQWFKPLYREYCEILHGRDKFAFFQTEGRVFEVIGDLIETGMDAVHVPLLYDDFEEVAEKFRGRVTFWGGINQSHIDPPSSRQVIHDAVLRVRRALDYGTGGVIAQCQWGPHIPLRNVTNFFEEWTVALPMTV